MKLLIRGLFGPDPPHFLYKYGLAFLLHSSFHWNYTEPKMTVAAIQATQPFWGRLLVPLMTLPGIALAQRTTVTSCLSPSSLRLVSKDSGLSGWAWSWPALTSVGSMVCKTLSRERQERRVGGMPRARAWEAARDKHTLGMCLELITALVQMFVTLHGCCIAQTSMTKSVSCISPTSIIKRFPSVLKLNWIPEPTAFFLVGTKTGKRLPLAVFINQRRRNTGSNCEAGCLGKIQNISARHRW